MNVKARYWLWVPVSILAIGTLGALGYRAVAGTLREAESQAPSPVDIGFAQSMIRHHDQAIVMTQVVAGDPNSRLGGLARAIWTAQLLEIGQMKGWLQLWHKPIVPTTSSMDWMLLGTRSPDRFVSKYLLDCRSSEGGMAGLATGPELNDLRARSGLERDRLFLELMFRHHQGAIPMARFVASNAKLEPVKAQAAAIVVEQTEELSSIVLRLRSIDKPLNPGQAAKG